MRMMFAKDIESYIIIINSNCFTFLRILTPHDQTWKNAVLSIRNKFPLHMHISIRITLMTLQYSAIL